MMGEKRIVEDKSINENNDKRGKDDEKNDGRWKENEKNNRGWKNNEKK